MTPTVRPARSRPLAIVPVGCGDEHPGERKKSEALGIEARHECGQRRHGRHKRSDVPDQVEKRVMGDAHRVEKSAKRHTACSTSAALRLIAAVSGATER